MALQPPVIAHHQPASTGLSRFSSQGSKCGLTRTSAALGFQLEKLQVSRGQLTPSFNSQGRSMHSSAIALAQSSQPTFAVTLEGIATTESSNLDDALKESVETFPMQVESSEQRLPQAISPPAEVLSTVESLNEPSASTMIDSGAGNGGSVSDFSPLQPDINIVNKGTDMETLRSNAEALLNGAASDSSQEAAKTATDSFSSDQFKSAKEAYEALLSGSQDSTEQDSSIDALSQASQSLIQGFSEAKSAVVNGFTKVQESIHSSVDNAIMTVKSTYENINGSIVNSFKKVPGLDGNSMTVLEPSGADKFATAQESFLDILTSPLQMGTPVNNALKGAVTAVESITGKVLVSTSDLIANGYSFAKEVLPADARVYLSGFEEKLTEISGPIQTILQQGYALILDAEKAAGINPENPIIPVFVVVGGSISLTILYRQLRYGGYSGDLAPASALDLLKQEGNTVLVDIRSEDIRESEGIPDLRRQARFKVANVEQFKLQGSLPRMLKNAADAEAAITALAVKNLKIVQGNTQVIILDSDGSQSKSIARALKKMGIKTPYRIDGGFRAWEASGLRVKQVGAETPLTIIKEETEAILEEVKPTPIGIAATTLGVFAGIYALIEWEKTLQVLGLICIAQVLYTRVNSYESAEDAKDDIKVLLRPFALATQGIVWAAGQFEPSKLQLATSPSTSAVQDRVLQAAAKHGPLPSEYDQEQQEAQPSEGVAVNGAEDNPGVPE